MTPYCPTISHLKSILACQWLSSLCICLSLVICIYDVILYIGTIKSFLLNDWYGPVLVIKNNGSSPFQKLSFVLPVSQINFPTNLDNLLQNFKNIIWIISQKKFSTTFRKLYVWSISGLREGGGSTTPSEILG